MNFNTMMVSALCQSHSVKVLMREHEGYHVSFEILGEKENAESFTREVEELLPISLQAHFISSRSLLFARIKYYFLRLKGEIKGNPFIEIEFDLMQEID